MFLTSSALGAQVEGKPRSAPNADVLDAATWNAIDASVERALDWLAKGQSEDGSFDSLELCQPGVTALGLMAFLARGESPVDGKYQQQVGKAIDYIANQQKPNGLIVLDGPGAVPIPRHIRPGGNRKLGVSVVYNHAIAALSLCEAYGQCSPEQTERLAPVIEKAILATLEMQRWGKRQKIDKGGWRYIDQRHANGDSDLSVTGWQIMFLRSARNAGFEVPKESVDAGVNYIQKCFQKHTDRKVFGYVVSDKSACTRGMAGAGVLALAHAGKHDSEQAIQSGDWILKHGFEKYNDDTPVYGSWLKDRYHYGALQCTQAMYQLGGKYWDEFFPTLVTSLLANQKADGSWEPEAMEPHYGNRYTTALCILSLSVPDQMLPIFQR